MSDIILFFKTISLLSVLVGEQKFYLLKQLFYVHLTAWLNRIIKFIELSHCSSYDSCYD